MSNEHAKHGSAATVCYLAGLKCVIYDPQTDALMFTFDSFDARADFVEHWVPSFAVGEMRYNNVKADEPSMDYRVWFELSKQANPLILQSELAR